MAATCTVSLSLTGYTSSLAAGSYPMGTEVTIVLTVAPYYTINPAALPVIQYRRYGSLIGEETFTQISDTQCSLTTKLNPFDDVPSGDYTCIGQIRGTSIMSNAEIANNLIGCTSNFPDGFYSAGETTIRLTCPDNFEFDYAPYLEYNQTAIKVITVEFEKESDTSYTATLTLTAGKTYTVTGEAVKQTPISDKYGFIRAYRLTRDEVIAASNKRWIEITFEPEKYQGVNVLYNPNEQYIDTAKFVVSLFKLFVPLETELKHDLTFGPYSMDMEVDVISDDIIALDFGSVELKGKYGNAIDYKNTDIEIYLPFIGFTSISPTDFMDKEVNLTYQINAMNGDALAILTAAGQVLFSQSCNVAMKIPFQLGINEYLSTSLEPNNNYLANEPPFILVKTHKAAAEAPAAPYRDTKFYACLGDLSGYTEAQELDFVVLSDFITQTEVAEIESLLEDGVFL